MFDLYASLRSLEYFIDNEYLEKYCRLIEQHTRTKVFGGKTHKHHIIPKSWFKLTNNKVNNDLSNLVNLTKREHVLAHYYLCLCTADPFKFANELAIICLQNKYVKDKGDKLLFENLPLYKYILEDYLKKLKSNYKLYGSKR